MNCDGGNGVQFCGLSLPVHTDPPNGYWRLLFGTLLDRSLRLASFGSLLLCKFLICFLLARCLGLGHMTEVDQLICSIELNGTSNPPFLNCGGVLFILWPRCSSRISYMAQ